MSTRKFRKRVSRLAQAVALCVTLLTPAIRPDAQTPPGAGTTRGYLFDDVHFHLTNYVQEGIPVRDFLKIMGDKAGRSTLFGIP